MSKKPLPRKTRVVNRGYQYSRKKEDKVKNISVTLKDIDSTIIYYLENVIQPSVEENGENIKVPTLYGSVERWKSVKRDGFLRDKKRQIITPLIMFKRNTIEKRRDLGKKMDANNPQLQYTFQKKYTKRNQYDNFSVLQDRIPQRELHAVVIPDFVIINYNFIIWTDFVSHNNKIVEAINYASDAYWGDEERFKFNARIDSFTNTVDVVQGRNRMIKTNFELDLQGYIVSDAMSTAIAKKPQKFFSKSTVVFNTEIITTSGPAKTREEVRKESGEYKVGRNGEGIGYEGIGDDTI